MKVTVTLPNFSLSRGQLPPDVSPHRSRSVGRRIRSVLAWGGLGLLVFLTSAWLAMPTRAMAWRLSHEAHRAGYRVDIEDLTVLPWGVVKLENVRWMMDPSRPGEPPYQYKLDEVRVGVSLLGLMSGTVDVSVGTTRDPGKIWGRFVQNEVETQVQFSVDDLPLYDVPKAVSALGVPLFGSVRLEGDIVLPKGKLGQAEGTIEMACLACRAGDGEAKLFIPGSKTLASEGLTIPEIDLGTLTGKFVVKKGRAELDPPIETESDDLKLSISGSLDLKNRVQRTLFDMILKVELSEAMQERNERVRFMYQGASAKSKLDPPETGLGFKLMGSLQRPKFYGIKAKTPRERLADRRARNRRSASSRPTRPAPAPPAAAAPPPPAVVPPRPPTPPPPPPPDPPEDEDPGAGGADPEPEPESEPAEHEGVEEPTPDDSAVAEGDGEPEETPEVHGGEDEETIVIDEVEP